MLGETGVGRVERVHPQGQATRELQWEILRRLWKWPGPVQGEQIHSLDPLPIQWEGELSELHLLESQPDPQDSRATTHPEMGEK